MRLLTRSLVIALLVGVIFSHAPAQSPQKQGTGIITGRVSSGDKGIANVAVVLYQSVRTTNQRTSVARTTTDHEGYYKLSGVPGGRYSVVAVAPALIGPNDDMYGELGKSVTLAEGETAEKIDFALFRGGVITGRVTDADGAPVVAERITLSAADSRDQRGRGYSAFNPFMQQTDDRGIYRIYGIIPGKYRVSVGEALDAGSVRVGFGRRGYFTRVFHPNVTDESKATIIEVTEGSEASNVDITLGRKAQSFSASGRVVDESGQPVPSVHVGHGALAKGQNSIDAYGSGSTTDERGRFRIDGVIPGRYAAFVWSNSQIAGYTNPVQFEISEGDVSGLELTLRRGSSISGVAVIEGTANRNLLAKLSQLSLGAAATQQSERLMAPNFVNSKIAPDGSFLISGLHAGKVRLYLSTYPPLAGFSLARIERDGVPQNELEIVQGAQVTGLRVVIQYGSGSIRGLVKIENGPLPEGARMYIAVRRVGDAGFMQAGAQVDSRGRFLVEGLATGDYELVLQHYSPNVRTRGMPPVKQTVSVTSGVESEATLTFDLNAAPKEDGRNE